ncbi:L-aminopeptidase/D-esterase-like protein [Streptomyces brevispora]|uniref:L-aminopeptidase/D-esterase-like protein n=1 Tax=Streptomyces brevispora TaxID=887462 RepID=A0A561UWM7_9ACTN|nr:L-aminopeptidase/D-esterase-like protein [Streptomyces brevispora]
MTGQDSADPLNPSQPSPPSQSSPPSPPSEPSEPSPPSGPPQPAGRLDALTDVAWVRVGHARVVGEGALSGTTVILAPEGGAVAAVDVRGGGPGTRETDALDPRNLVQRIDAVVLTGGSAYGLDAASGVMAWLEEQGRGVRVGADPAQVVPVVPAACVFDLGRGGDWRARPDASTGRAAVEDAACTEPGAAVAEGCVGAGTGAVAGRLKGGVGTASVLLPSGITVGALVVVNAAGSVLDPRTGVLYGEYGAAEPAVAPAPEIHHTAQQRLAQARDANARPPLNTTLAVVATDADLSRAQAQKLAGTAHDGLARAIRPVHLLTDGDTVFALATGGRTLDPANPIALNDLLAAGAEAVTRAIVKAVRAATGVNGSEGGGTYLSYSDLYGVQQHSRQPEGDSSPETESPCT